MPRGRPKESEKQTPHFYTAFKESRKFELYRNHTKVGRSLFYALEKMVEREDISPQVAVAIIQQFDYEIIKRIQKFRNEEEITYYFTCNRMKSYRINSIGQNYVEFVLEGVDVYQMHSLQNVRRCLDYVKSEAELTGKKWTKTRNVIRGQSKYPLAHTELVRYRIKRNLKFMRIVAFDEFGRLNKNLIQHQGVAGKVLLSCPFNPNPKIEVFLFSPSRFNEKTEEQSNEMPVFDPKSLAVETSKPQVKKNVRSELMKKNVQRYEKRIQELQQKKSTFESRRNKMPLPSSLVVAENKGCHVRFSTGSSFAHFNKNRTSSQDGADLFQNLKLDTKKYQTG